MKNNTTILAIILAFLSGLLLGVYGGFGLIEPVVTTTTLAVAAAAWWESRREARRGATPIPVILRSTSPEDDLELPLHLLRRDVTRAELLGRIGMVPLKGGPGRFSLTCLSTPEFLERLNWVQEGNSPVLNLPATANEIDQFDL